MPGPNPGLGLFYELNESSSILAQSEVLFSPFNAACGGHWLLAF